jgi:hypothetical protein
VSEEVSDQECSRLAGGFGLWTVSGWTSNQQVTSPQTIFKRAFKRPLKLHCSTQGTAELAVHTLQTGWCFYSGLEAAKRSNVWVASQSPAALAMLAAAGAAAGSSPASDRSQPPSESLMQVHTTHFLSFASKCGTADRWSSHGTCILWMPITAEEAYQMFSAEQHASRRKIGNQHLLGARVAGTNPQSEAAPNSLAGTGFWFSFLAWRS